MLQGGMRKQAVHVAKGVAKLIEEFYALSSSSVTGVEGGPPVEVGPHLEVDLMWRLDLSGREWISG